MRPLRFDAQPPGRRAFLKSACAAVALSACQARPDLSAAAVHAPGAALKDVLACPAGVCATAAELTDPDFTTLLLSQFNQITPEWEMKMERLLADDGSWRWDAADAIADFVRVHRLRLHGTTLVWYAQKPPSFARLDGQGSAFAEAYRHYILTVAGRYRGLAAGWDVLNEPVAEDGDGYRDSLWRRNLGMDHARLAFVHAREADPDALLFLNDYNLETNPKKLDAFQRLLEGLLKSGAPVTGLGTQTHLSADTPPGQAGRAITALARFGLPIHVSELDVSTRATGVIPPRADVLRQQARVVGEVADAFFALPAAQRYAFTVWGLRDRDSWLRQPPNAGDGTDRPVLFDDQGRAKPAFDAVVARAPRPAA